MVNKNASEKELFDIGISKSETVISYIDKTGKECDQILGVAKLVKSVDEFDKSKSNTNYYIKYRRGELFDPYGIDALKVNAKDTKYRKVDKDIYEKYCTYLQTRREVFFLEAKRDFIRKGF